jgi:hypothetical protein
VQIDVSAKQLFGVMLQRRIHVGDRAVEIAGDPEGH